MESRVALSLLVTSLALALVACGDRAAPSDASGSGKTPDGYTPAEEKVCDEYDGRAFGLCNSYCEARDCDDPRVHAADRSCEVTERLFEKLTGAKLICPSDDDECTETVTANPDYLFVARGDCDSIDPVTNDTSSDGATPVLVSFDAPVLMTESGGVFEYCYTGTESVFSETINYTICHPTCTTSCSSSTIFAMGS